MIASLKKGITADADFSTELDCFEAKYIISHQLVEPKARFNTRKAVFTLSVATDNFRRK